MERSIDGCIAASGLIDYEEESAPLIKDHRYSTITSSTSSHITTRDSTNRVTPTSRISGTPLSPTGPAMYASILAKGVLKLMSLSTGIRSPLLKGQLQLRIAMHSGPCSAGVVSLQTTVGTQHIPHYKLFGPTVNFTNKLCTTGLALQIRISKACWELLNKVSGYHFERCPDYMTWNGQKPLESYWLVGHNELQYDLPCVDQAISLSEYEDNY